VAQRLSALMRDLVGLSTSEGAVAKVFARAKAPVGAVVGDLAETFAVSK
jgi:hypothetical protein